MFKLRFRLSLGAAMVGVATLMGCGPTDASKLGINSTATDVFANSDEFIFDEKENDEYLSLLERGDCRPNCLVSTSAINAEQNFQTAEDAISKKRHRKVADHFNQQYLEGLSGQFNEEEYIAIYKFTLNDDGSITLPKSINRIQIQELRGFESLSKFAKSPPVDLIYPFLDTLDERGYINVIDRRDGQIRTFEIIKEVEGFDYTDLYLNRHLDLQPNEFLWKVPFFRKLNLVPGSAIRLDKLDKDRCRLSRPITYYRATFEPIGFWGKALFSDASELYLSSCDNRLYGQSERKIFKIDFNF